MAARGEEITVAAEPYEFVCRLSTTALLVIDMQRDFVDPGGFGELLGNDVTPLRRAVEPIRRVLTVCRDAELLIVHTREGHRADLSDCPPSKKARGRLRRIEGQVQGLQRMLENDAYCVDILLQISAVQGALEQCQKLLLGRHIESCVADAMRSGSRGDRQQKIEELLDVFARFGGR